MVDAGSRAASVTIHRVMDVEHGLGNVKGEIMLDTLLNHCVKYYGKPNNGQIRSRRSFSRSSVSTWSGCQEHTSRHRSWGRVLENMSSWKTPLIQSNSQQFVWLEGLLTVFRFMKSLMNALQLTMTHIETVDSLRDSCCLEKTPTDKTACEDLDLAQCSVELVDEAAKQRPPCEGRVYKAYIEEELSLRKRRKEIHHARPWRHWAAGEWCWYWRSGKYKGS